jgi:hypothetical protein
MAVCGRGYTRRAIWKENSMNLPSFRSRSGGGILRATIIHYNGNKCTITMSCMVF